MSECAVMVDFDHPNIVKLIGVCFDTTDQLPFIILPFMVNRDLKSFLTSKREQTENLKTLSKLSKLKVWKQEPYSSASL